MWNRKSCFITIINYFISPILSFDVASNNIYMTYNMLEIIFCLFKWWWSMGNGLNKNHKLPVHRDDIVTSRPVFGKIRIICKCVVWDLLDVKICTNFRLLQKHWKHNTGYYFAIVLVQVQSQGLYKSAVSICIYFVIISSTSPKSVL